MKRTSIKKYSFITKYFISKGKYGFDFAIGYSPFAYVTVKLFYQKVKFLLLTNTKNSYYDSNWPNFYFLYFFCYDTNIFIPPFSFYKEFYGCVRIWTYSKAHEVLSHVRNISILWWYIVTYHNKFCILLWNIDVFFILIMI